MGGAKEEGVGDLGRNGCVGDPQHMAMLVALSHRSTIVQHMDMLLAINPFINCTTYGHIPVEAYMPTSGHVQSLGQGKELCES